MSQPAPLLPVGTGRWPSRKTFRRRRPQRFLRGVFLWNLAVAAAVWVASSCGFEYLPSLRPPVNARVLQDTFYFESALETGLYFMGYELYYKLYHQDEQTSLNAEANLTSVRDLTTRGYLRVTGAGDSVVGGAVQPLVRVDQGLRDQDGLLVSITFPSYALTGDEPYITVSWSTAALPIRRSVPYPQEIDFEQHYKEFSRFSEDDLQPGTANPTDLRTEVWGAMLAGDAVYVALYALSYGVQDFATRVYSDPLYLSYIAVQLGVAP